MSDEDIHQGNAYGGNDSGAGIGAIGWMLLPLIPSIIFVVYFLVSGKIVT